MKYLQKLFIVFAALTASAHSVPQAGARCPIGLGVLRDGGSLLIEVPATNDSPEILFREDHAAGTKTPGRYFRRSSSGTFKEEIMEVREVLKAYQQIESILIERYGRDELFRMVMNPVVRGVHLSNEEYADQFRNEPRFVEERDVQELLERIRSYRKEHKSEVVPDHGDKPTN